MMEGLYAVMSVQREILIYIACGVIAASLNLFMFYVLDNIVQMHYLKATAVAWMCSTTFAFFTNKFIVFHDYDITISILVREIFTFLSSRGISGFMDFAGMYILVSCLDIRHDIAKITVLCLIVITNYILSKYWVFKKGHSI